MIPPDKTVKIDNDFFKRYLKIKKHPEVDTRLRKMIELIGYDKNQSVLDIGCGLGDLLWQLKKSGFKDVSGVDHSEAAVKYVRKLGMKIFKADIVNDRDIKLKKFDTVILGDILEHQHDPRRLVWKIFDSYLKPDGKMIVSVPNPQWVINIILRLLPRYYLVFSSAYGSSSHIHQFTLKQVRQLFAGFKIAELRGVPFKYTFFKTTKLWQQIKINLVKALINPINLLADIYPRLFSTHYILVITREQTDDE